jgi:hypothetical protein
MDRTSRRKAMAIIDRGLASAAGLTPAKIAMYRAAAEKVIKAMGPKALERWNANVEMITFYPDTGSVTRFARSLRPDLDDAVDIRGLCARNPSQPHLCSLHLNGGGDTGDRFSRNTCDGYAHEFAHAVDWSNGELSPLSLTQAWKDAWQENKDVINGRLDVADQSPSEGFANFAIFVWNYPEDARRHCPACRRFWKNHGLA